jgi:hypothetical protein
MLGTMTWQALHLAEAIGAMYKPEGGASGASATHPRVIPVLMSLADVYSHTDRLTLAEGLYR